MRVGVLVHDNGEFDAYVGYFDDPERLRAAVRRLDAERMDKEAGEPCEAYVSEIELESVPDVVDDAFLDHLAVLLQDAGLEIESADDRRERLRTEAEGELIESIPAVVPGQIPLDGFTGGEM